jgi:hypothetical protein
MFVDEVGNSDLGSSDDVNHRYLSVTGLIVDMDHYREFIDPHVRLLKMTVFGTDSIVLHRREILDKKPPFECLKDPVKNEDFGARILCGLRDWEYKVISIVIDKRSHREKYTKWHFHPYHYCMTCLLERYVMFLNRQNGRGDVLAESRNRCDDEKLKGTYKTFHQRGSNHVKARSLLDRLTTGELKLSKKSANMNGLQIADLIANPSFRAILCEKTGIAMTAKFSSQIIEILNCGKYDDANSGTVWGTGKKWLP